MIVGTLNVLSITAVHRHLKICHTADHNVLFPGRGRTPTWASFKFQRQQSFDSGG